MNTQENSTDIKAVRLVVESYANATYEADVDALRTIFHGKAVMQGDLPNGRAMGNLEPFFQDLSSRPSMKSEDIQYSGDITYINVASNVASVTLTESNLFGSSDFVNYLSLIKEDSQWKIISKTFTYV